MKSINKKVHYFTMNYKNLETRINILMILAIKIALIITILCLVKYVDVICNTPNEYNTEINTN